MEDVEKDSLSTDTWICLGCKKEFKELSSKIQECEICEEHYCARCVKMTHQEYDLSTRKDIHWFCPPHKLKVMQNISTEKETEKKTG